MTINDCQLYRALRGGVWERTKSCGWYRMRTPCGIVPPNSEDYEDHREAWPLIVVCVAAIVSISVCSIIVLMARG